MGTQSNRRCQSGAGCKVGQAVNWALWRQMVTFPLPSLTPPYSCTKIWKICPGQEPQLFSLIPTSLAPGQPRPGSRFYSLRVYSPTMAHMVDDKLTTLGLQPLPHPCFCCACHSFALLLLPSPPALSALVWGILPQQPLVLTHGLQLQAQLAFSPASFSS